MSSVPSEVKQSRVRGNREWWVGGGKIDCLGQGNTQCNSPSYTGNASKAGTAVTAFRFSPGWGLDTTSMFSKSNGICKIPKFYTWTWTCLDIMRVEYVFSPSLGRAKSKLCIPSSELWLANSGGSGRAKRQRVTGSHFPPGPKRLPSSHLFPGFISGLRPPKQPWVNSSVKEFLSPVG